MKQENPLKYIRRKDIKALKNLIPHIALNLGVYIFGESAKTRRYGTIQLEAKILGSGHKIQEATERKNATGSCHALARRIFDLYYIDKSKLSDGDRIDEAIIVQGNTLVDMLKDGIPIGGSKTYIRFRITYEGVPFELYASAAPLPGSENTKLITTRMGPNVPNDLDEF